MVDPIVPNIIDSLVDLQLDAQNSYLFTYNTFIKVSSGAQ